MAVRRTKYTHVVRSLVFLDSRDLINCVEHSRPFDYATLANQLQERNAAVILTMTNVLETVPRGRSVSDIVELARRLESIPHVFVRYSEISKNEFSDAVAAFDRNVALVPSLRMIRSFWRVLVPEEIADNPDSAESHRLLDLLPMSEQLRLAFLDGPQLGPSDDFDPITTAELGSVLATHRDILGVRVPSKALFRHSVTRQLEHLKLTVSDGSGFANWMFRSPMVCPGWRLGHEVFQELRLDQSARINGNGVTDLTHVYFIPYVSAATLDNQWRSYCDRVVGRLEKIGIRVPYGHNLYPNVEKLFQMWPASGA